MIGTVVTIWLLIGVLTFIAEIIIDRHLLGDIWALVSEMPSKTKAVAGLIAHLIWHIALGPINTYILIHRYRVVKACMKEVAEIEAQREEERRKAKEEARDWRFEE